MKKLLKSCKFLLVIALFAAVVPLLAQDDIRYCAEVDDVSGAITPNYIVKPAEEPRGDHSVSNAPECDIKAITGANDGKQLRIGIILHRGITFKKQVVYGFQLRYSGVEEWYVYNPITKKMLYIKKQEGRDDVVKDLPMNLKHDYAWVGDQMIAGGKNTVVSLLIDKDRHFSKSGKGSLKWIRLKGYSGYVKANTENDLGDADETIEVKMGYRR